MCIDSGTDLNKNNHNITNNATGITTERGGERDRSLKSKAPKRYWSLSHSTKTNETIKRKTKNKKQKTKTNKNKINYINQIKYEETHKK